jgi:hypothetical protein
MKLKPVFYSFSCQTVKFELTQYALSLIGDLLKIRNADVEDAREWAKNATKSIELNEKVFSLYEHKIGDKTVAARIQDDQ